MVVFGEYADGSAYVELDVVEGINFYTGTVRYIVNSDFKMLI